MGPRVDQPALVPAWQILTQAGVARSRAWQAAPLDDLPAQVSCWRVQSLLLLGLSGFQVSSHQCLFSRSCECGCPASEASYSVQFHTPCTLVSQLLFWTFLFVCDSFGMRMANSSRMPSLSFVEWGHSRDLSVQGYSFSH